MRVVLWFTLLAFFVAGGALGEEKKKKPSEKPRIRKAKNEKETEGTEAHDRFEADTVIKSKYQLNGESLEVDPD